MKMEKLAIKARHPQHRLVTNKKSTQYDGRVILNVCVNLYKCYVPCRYNGMMYVYKNEWQCFYMIVMKPIDW